MKIKLYIITFASLSITTSTRASDMESKKEVASMSDTVSRARETAQNAPAIPQPASNSRAPSLEESLFHAVIDGKTDVVQSLITQKADVNAVSSVNETPLMHAVSQDHSSIVYYLLNNKAHVNRQNNEGQTALFFAAKNNKPSIARMLLRMQANPNIAAHDEQTPLMHTAANLNKEMVLLLLAHRANGSISTLKYGNIIGQAVDKLVGGKDDTNTREIIKILLFSNDMLSTNFPRALTHSCSRIYDDGNSVVNIIYQCMITAQEAKKIKSAIDEEKKKSEEVQENQTLNKGSKVESSVSSIQLQL